MIRRLAVLALALLAVLGAAAGAAGVERLQPPTKLWSTYPLNPARGATSAPTPTRATPPSTPAPAPAAARRLSASGGSGGSGGIAVAIVAAAVGAAILAGGVAIFLWSRRRRRAAPESAPTRFTVPGLPEPEPEPLIEVVELPVNGRPEHAPEPAPVIESPMNGLAHGASVSLPTGGTVVALAAPVRLSTASERELRRLEGVGPALAARIVAWREARGGVTSIDELLEVPGIGRARLERLRGRLVL